MSEMENDSEKWDLVLRPKNKWYEIDIKGVWHYRDLIFLFVRRDFISSYKQTILGPIWMILQPLISTLMFTFIFGVVAKISTGGAPRILFYMAAFVPWTFFADCFNKTSSTFTGNAGIFGKVYFPRLVSPLSSVISNLFKFLVQFILFLIIYGIFIFKGAQVSANYHVVFLPILLIVLAGFGFSFGLIVSSLTTKYRDITFLVGIALQAMMYCSSVVFSIDIFGPSIRKYLIWNPMLWVIEGFRYATLGVGSWSWHGLIYATAFMIVTMFFSIVVFSKVEKNFMDTV
jgi:lipopolysaccharide transport system permease protein